MASHVRIREREDHVEVRRSGGAARGGAGVAGEPGRRQAGGHDEGGRRRQLRPQHPLLRRRRRQDPRRDAQDVAAAARVHPPLARRRGGDHRAVELPRRHVLLQGLTRSRRRLHHGRQARRADASQRPLPRPPRKAGRDPRWGDQRGHRIRPNRGSCNFVSQGHRRGGFHGIYGGWTAGNGSRREEQPEAGGPGAWRQVGADHLRRRRPRQGRRTRHQRELFEQGRSLRLWEPSLRAGGHLRPVRAEDSRRHEELGRR